MSPITRAISRRPCLLPGHFGTPAWAAFWARSPSWRSVPILRTLEPVLAKNPGSGVAALFGPARPFIQVLVVLGVIQGNVMNLYSAYMSSMTIFTA